MTLALEATTLSDLAEVAAGQAAPQGAHHFSGTGAPFIRAGSLDALVSGGREEDCERISSDVAEGHGLRLFPKDTILFAKSGMSATLGRVYRLRAPAYVVSHLAAVIPGRRVDPSFLQRWFEWSPPSRLIPNAAYPSIRLSEIEQLEVPIPFPDDPRRSLAEQKRIAAILDKADAIRRRRQEAARLADTLGLAALVNIAGDPIINPHSWQMQPLQLVCSTITDGEHLNPLFTSNGVPMVMAANVREDGVDLINTKCISEEDYERFTKKCYPQRNDVLVVSRGATIGRCTRVDTDHRFALMGSVILLKLDNERMLPTYLQVLLTHPAYRARLFTTSSASAQQAIYLSHIKKLLVPVPPMSIQREHSRLVEWVDAHRSRVRVGRDSIEELFAALVQSAFRGEL